MTLSSQQPSRLCDYFVICGLDYTSGLEQNNLSPDTHLSPLERPYKGKVLEHYPNAAPGNPFDQNAVCMLCLPNGLQFRTQKNLIDAKFHSFVVTKEDGNRYYGFSLIFFEEVRNSKISSAIQILQAMHLEELSSMQTAGKSPIHNSRSLPRHFKLAAHQPHAAQNYYDKDKDILYASKCIAIIMRIPYVVAVEAFLRQLQRYAMTKPVPGQLSVESYVYNFLYEVPTPGPGRCVKVHIVSNDALMIQRPIAIEELPLLDFSLRDLFTLLKVEQVVQLFTCILLESQVLITSSDYQKLMLVAECVTSLLFPFAWQHVYVPILPASLQHFLDAPVPYIMGLPAQDSQVPIASEADLCYLNIDNGVMQVPEERPSFPRRTEFCEELTSLLSKFGVSKKQDQRNNDLMSSSVIVPGGYPEPLRRKHSWSHDADDTRRLIDVTRLYDVELEEDDGVKTESGDAVDLYLKQLTFNNAVRETFLHSFVNIFTSYEKFVIMPREDEKEEWFQNRETMANFDKATFLSDQPQQDLPFLSQFLETQMFASLIDSKIMAAMGEPVHNLRVFDKRIKNFSKRNNSDDKKDVCEAVIRESQLLIEKRFSTIDYTVPPPREILPAPSDHFRLRKTPKTFPSLDGTALSKEPASRSRSSNSNGQRSQHRKHRAESGMASYGSKHGMAHSPARIAQANWNFVEKLLKDCKSKTNRMVVEKMGAEGVVLPSRGDERVGSVEENTMIASFCDHLEKVWSHGMQQKQGKSALWSHLKRYKELTEIGGESLDTSVTVSPAVAWCALRKRIDYLSSLAQDFDFSSRSNDASPCNTPDSRSLERRISRGNDQPLLKPLPVSVAFDVRNVEAMSEIKSEIGFSRAWIRLSLEKKLLSRHLTSLLSDAALLKAQYKRNAFLRCEEEREQFLFHLLSLNAVDYYCFTNTYPSSKLPYRVIINPSRRPNVSTTTANVWVAISGTLCETSPQPVPKDSIDFIIQHKNLGMLTTLRIGHDNTGHSPNWMVDVVIVRCEVTGHTFRFPCGRYLGRSVEDGSTERLLVGETVKTPLAEIGEVSAPTPRSPIPSRRQTQLSIAELQHMIGDSVNNIVKFFYRHGKQASQRGALTPLLCGEMGLVHSLQQAFLFGFKASRLFSRRLYLWDFFLRVKDYFESCQHNSRRSRDSGSLDRRLYNNRMNNNNNNNYDSERAATMNRSRDSDSNSWRSCADGQIPRANRALSSERRPNHNLSLPRGRDSSAGRWRMAEPVVQDVLSNYCSLVAKIDNSSRAVGKDGKFQQFICLAVRERILHSILHPIATCRPTLEMYEEHSFLRDTDLRTFLVEILGSLAEYDVNLEASITLGID